MIASMRAGSVIVDLAVEQGGNVTKSVGGEIVTTENGVIVMGHYNLPSRLASDASALYARNLFNFVEPMIDKETRQLAIDWDDEIITGSCLTRDGKIVHPALLPQNEPLIEPVNVMAPIAVPNDISTRLAVLMSPALPMP